MKLESIKNILSSVIQTSVGLSLFLRFFVGVAFGQTFTPASLTISPPNPVPGETVTINLNYCSTNQYNSTVVLLAVNDNGVAGLESCQVGTAGQCFLADVNGINNNCVDQALGFNQAGYTYPADGNQTTCVNVTRTYYYQLPADTYGVTYCFTALVSPNNYFCGNAASVTETNCLTVPEATSSTGSGVKTVNGDIANGASAADGDYILFSINYDFSHTTSASTISDPIPANTTLVSEGPPGYVTSTGGPVVWTIPANAGNQTGQVWMLVKVNAGTANNTVIPNQATINPGGGTSSSTNTVTATVNGGGFNLVKTQSAAVLAPGQTETYTLSYNINGESLQWYDSYDNNTAGTSNGNILDMGGVAYELYGLWCQRVRLLCGSFWIRHYGSSRAGWK